MNLVVQTIKKIIFPLGIIITIVVGIIAAALSAFIEIDVVQNCFSSSSNGNFFFFPIIIVITFEVMKIAMHFCEKAFFKSNFQNISKKMALTFSIVKWSLISFSVLCSFIFTAHSFYESVPERREEFIATKVQSIEEKYREEYNQYNTSIEEKFNVAVFAAKEKKDKTFDEYDNIIVVYTPQVEYVRTSTEKRAAYERYIEALKEYEELIKVETEKKESLLNDKKEEIKINYSLDTEIITEEAKSTSEFDNPYIRKFLLSIAHTFGVDDYNRMVYMITICGISIFISFILESIISISFSIMSLPPEVLLNAVTVPEYIENIREDNYEKLLNMIINILLSFAVFSVYALAVELSFGGRNIFIAIACFIFVVLVSRNLPAERKTSSNIGHYIYEARVHVMKGAIGFAGYIVLGLIFGSTIQELTPAAVGITLGSSIGGAVGNTIKDVAKI